MFQLLLDLTLSYLKTIIEYDVTMCNCLMPETHGSTQLLEDKQLSKYNYSNLFISDVKNLQL